MLMHILGTKHLLISEHVKIPKLGRWHGHVRQMYVRNEQQKCDPCIRSYNAHNTTHIFYSKHETTTCTQFSATVFVETNKMNITKQRTESTQHAHGGKQKNSRKNRSLNKCADHWDFVEHTKPHVTLIQFSHPYLVFILRTA